MLTVNNLNGFDAQAASNNVLVFTINVNTDTDRFLLTTALTSAGWDGITPVAVTVVNTATIYSSVPGTAAFRTGTIPAGSSIYLDSTAGSILGAGGLGGAGGGACSSGGQPGAAGGHAIELSFPIRIALGTDGRVWGGGGGGGGGGAGNSQSWEQTGESQWGNVCHSSNGAGGGGGAGRNPGSGSGTGTSGTQTAGGEGGPKVGDGAAGGRGGGPGLAGSPGANATLSGGPGGAAGRAVKLNGNSVTWLSGFNSAQVRGAVS